MRCERCKFENIPGQSTCIKCGSVLEISTALTDIYPPRMSRWEKPFRNFSRSIRKNRAILYIHAKLHTPQWLRDVLGDMTVGVFLCIIPGLGHLINKRFKEIWWYFLAWIVLLLTGIFFYGTNYGYFFIGLAIGIHVVIAILYGLFKDLESFREKAAVFFFLLIGFLFLYRFVPRMIFPYLTGSYSSMDIPYYNVSEGDYLLARSDIDREIILDRGSLVVFNPVAIGGHQPRRIRSNRTTIGEITGLPGENIQILKGVFIIDGQPLDVEQYPVPGWLRNRTFSFIIPKDSYFVSSRYNITAHGIVLTDSNIIQVCIVNKSSIEAKAFMRWLPIARRGFLP